MSELVHWHCIELVRTSSTGEKNSEILSQLHQPMESIHCNHYSAGAHELVRTSSTEWQKHRYIRPREHAMEPKSDSLPHGTGHDFPCTLA